MHANTEFFEYLLLLKPTGADGTGLQLHKLLGSGCSLGDGGLLQVQASLFGTWQDFVQKSDDGERFFHCIPEALWNPELLRTGGIVCVNAILVLQVT